MAARRQKKTRSNDKDSKTNSNDPSNDTNSNDPSKLTEEGTVHTKAKKNNSNELPTSSKEPVEGQVKENTNVQGGKLIHEPNDTNSNDPSKLTEEGTVNAKDKKTEKSQVKEKTDMQGEKRILQSNDTKPAMKKKRVVMNYAKRGIDSSNVYTCQVCLI